MSLEPTILSTLRNGDPTVAVAADLLHNSLEVLGRSVFVEQITVNRIRASSYDPYGGMRDGAVVFDLVMSASLPPKRRKVSIAVRVQEGVAYAPSTFTDSAGREHILSQEAMVKHLGGMLGDYPCPKRMPRAFLGLTDRTLYPTLPARNFFMLANRRTARHADHDDDYLDSVWSGDGTRLSTEEMLAEVEREPIDWVETLERTGNRPVLTTFSPQDADEALEQAGDSWGELPEVSSDELARGMNVELEHADLTGGDPLETAEIAIDHLKESPDYYKKLKEVESQGHVGNPGTPGAGGRPTLDDGAARSDEPWVQHMGPAAWGSQINTPVPRPNDRSGFPTPTSAG